MNENFAIPSTPSHVSYARDAFFFGKSHGLTVDPQLPDTAPKPTLLGMLDPGILSPGPASAEAIA